MKNTSKAEEEYQLVEPLVIDEQTIYAEEVKPIPVEEVSSSPPEGEKSLPMVIDQARGAAWGGGILGFIVGGPVMAFLLGFGGYHYATEDSGELGDFCRKTGDFTNKIGDDIKGKWENDESGNRNEERSPSNFRRKAGSFKGDKKEKISSKIEKFITRFGKSVNKRWDEAQSVPLREETTKITPNSMSD